MEIVTTELKDLKDLIKASRNVSSTVFAYRLGEIRLYKGIAYVVTSLGRNSWYILYTKNHNIDENTEFIEFTADEEIKKVNASEIGRDSRAIYFTILRPVKDEIIDSILKRIE